MTSAWLYFHGARAGLTRWEVQNLPLGEMQDQISCWLIEEKGYKEATGRSELSLGEQMRQVR